MSNSKKIYLTESQFGTLLVQSKALQELNEAVMLNENLEKLIPYIKRSVLAGLSAAIIFGTISHSIKMDEKQESKLWRLIELIEGQEQEEAEYAYDESQIMTGDSAPIMKGIEIMNYLMKNGATLEQAAGIAGNWHHESRFEANPTGIRDHGHSWGIAQWNDRAKAGARAQKLCKFFGLKSVKDIDKLNVYDQIDFALNGENMLGKFSGGETPEQAASIICAEYERPKNGRPGQSVNQYRQDLAKSYYNFYKQQMSQRNS